MRIEISLYYDYACHLIVYISNSVPHLCLIATLSRTSFYELNKVMEIARSHLPNNAWLKRKLSTYVNINDSCNAYWWYGSINFYRQKSGCGNTGRLNNQGDSCTNNHINVAIQIGGFVDDACRQTKQHLLQHSNQGKQANE